MAGNKKRSCTLILLLLAMIVLIIACVWLTSYKEKEAKVETGEESSEEAIISLDVDTIQSIYFKNENTEMTLLLNDQGIWKSAEDDNLPLDQSHADNMKNAFAKVTSSRTITEGIDDLASFGLDAPSIHVVATVNDGTKTDLVIGDKLPVGSGYYAILNGGKEIHVINSSFYNNFNKTAKEMVAVETIPTITASNITYLLVENKDKPSFEVSYDENIKSDYSVFTKWMMKQPYPTEIAADADELTTLFANYTDLTFLSCADYHVTDLSKYGLNDPTAVITLKYHEEEAKDEEDRKEEKELKEEKEVKEEKEFVLSIGSMDDEGNYYVKQKDSNAVHTLSADTISKLLDIDVYSYTFHNFNMFLLDEIDRVDIKLNDQTYTLLVERSKAIVDTEESKESATELTDANTDTDNTKYYFNGSLVEESEFKKLYQQIISPKTEREIPAEYYLSSSTSRTPNMTVTYHFTDGHTVTTQYLPYDESYYVVDINGIEYFLTDLRAINDMAVAVEKFSK